MDLPCILVHDVLVSAASWCHIENSGSGVGNLILLKQNEIIDALVQRVEKLEQSVPTKRNLFEVDVVATKESLRKLKETILGIFQ